MNFQQFIHLSMLGVRVASWNGFAEAAIQTSTGQKNTDASAFREEEQISMRYGWTKIRPLSHLSVRLFFPLQSHRFLSGLFSLFHTPPTELPRPLIFLHVLRSQPANFCSLLR